MALPKELPPEVVATIGQWGPENTGQVVLDRMFLDHWAEVLQDSNPLYTDDAFAARSRHGLRIAPATAMMALTMPFAWRPQGLVAQSPQGQKPPMSPYMYLRQTYKLGGAVARYLNPKFHKPVKLGDRLRNRSRIIGFEGPKATAVGEGYGAEQEMEWRNQNGELVATNRIKTFIYEAGPRPPEKLLHGFLPGIYDDLSGYKLPSHLPGEKPVQTLVYENTPLTLFRAASAMRDWNIYHVDNEHVRAHGGVVSMYNSLLFILALFNRFTDDWTGPDYDLRAIDGPVGALLHPGDTIRIEGAVTKRYVQGNEEFVELAAVMRTQAWTVMPATVTVSRPR